MRTNKNFTIDVELSTMLSKEENQSEIVNLALRDFFDKKSLRKLTPEELDKAIKIEEMKVRHARELEDLKNGIN